MKIVEISNEYFEQAINLVKLVFPYENQQEIELAFKGSLGDTAGMAWLKLKKCTSVKYFLAVENKEVIGTVGIYTNNEDDKEAAWLGWFCVSSEFRQKGIGKQILDYVINIAKEKNKKYFRLYTSDRSQEATAQILYDKLGFKTYKKENKDDELIISKQLIL